MDLAFRLDFNVGYATFGLMLLQINRYPFWIYIVVCHFPNKMF